jgi:hypothetical protein
MTELCGRYRQSPTASSCNSADPIVLEISEAGEDAVCNLCQALERTFVL